MPQKLIRLTSTTGDGVFNTTFNEEIVIPQNSEIALQSLTLERRSQEFAVNQDNNQIQFQGVGLVLPDVPTNSGSITPLGVYKNSNDDSLLTAIERTCNNNSSMLTTPESMNLQWAVDTGNDGKVEIRVVPSPLFPVTATAKLGTDGFYDLASANDWEEDSSGLPTTLATFKTTNTGSADFRKTNLRGDPPSYWYAVAGSETKWRIYNRRQLGNPTGTFKTAEVDGSGNIICDAPSTDTYTPTGDPPDLNPYEDAPPLSFVVNNRPLVKHIPAAERFTIGMFQPGEYGAYRPKLSTLTNNIAECYMYGSVPFIKSTGSFRARFRRLNTTNEDSAIMGVVKGAAGLAKLQNATLVETDFEYAIKIRGNNQPIQYKLQGGTYIDSGSTPVNHIVANPNGKNDVFEICLDNGDFLGIVNQNDSVQTQGTASGTDTAKLMPRQPRDPNEDYYFVLCLLENLSEIVLDNIGVSLDPFAFPTEGGMIPPRLIDTYLPNTSSDLTTLIKYDEKQVLAGAFNFVPPSNRNASLANFLGFPKNTLRQNAFFTAVPPIEVTNLSLQGSGLRQEYDLPEGFFWTAPEVFNLADMPQNIMVETQTFTLDSYDSYGLESIQRGAKSGGSRRNILATIPVQAELIAGTSNSMLQYEPGTLNYIGIKNRGAITTRQLRFRLLSSTYDDLVLENMAAMTLLIRSY